MGPARIEQALSEVASSISSLVPQRPVTNTVWHTQQNVWLLLAEVYLSQEQFDAANNCLLEAASIFPLSHHIMFMVIVLIISLKIELDRSALLWITI